MLCLDSELHHEGCKHQTPKSVDSNPWVGYYGEHIRDKTDLKQLINPN